jgi:hypothetical protein
VCSRRTQLHACALQLKYAANGFILTENGLEVLELRLPEFSASAARRRLPAHSKFDPTVRELHTRWKRHLLTQHVQAQ